jgi:hypothetical protein
MGRREIHIGFWCKNQKKSNNYEKLHVGERIILKWILLRENG